MPHHHPRLNPLPHPSPNRLFLNQLLLPARLARKVKERVNRKSKIKIFKMELKFILESLLFSAQKPLSVKELRDVLAAATEQEGADATTKSLAKTKDTELTLALEGLARDHEAAARSYRLACVPGPWQFVP